jgi:hypothetical protein
MRRTASEVISELETRIARLEGRTAGREYNLEAVARVTSEFWSCYNKMVFAFPKLGRAGVGGNSRDELQEAIEAIEKALRKIEDPSQGSF